MTATCSCGRRFNPALDHLGRKGAPPRLYCSVACREDARNARRRALREHLAENAALIEAHRQERDGLRVPLPSMPPLPPVPEFAP